LELPAIPLYHVFTSFYSVHRFFGSWFGAVDYTSFSFSAQTDIGNFNIIYPYFISEGSRWFPSGS